MRTFLLALLFATSAFSSVEGMADERDDAVRATISGQISAFGARQHDKAFEYAAPQIRQMFGSTSAFVAMVRQGYAPIYGARDVRFGRTKTDGPNRTFQEVLLTGPEGRSWAALYTLERGADGTWKIAGVRLVPGSEQTT